LGIATNHHSRTSKVTIIINTMKTSFAAVLFSSLASAWQLDLWGTDSRHATMHGTLDSGCVNIEFSPAINVNRVKFAESTFAGTFDLYANTNCNQLSYRENGGDFSINPRVIRSYKAY
jgi:hypothetical protein